MEDKHRWDVEMALNRAHAINHTYSVPPLELRMESSTDFRVNLVQTKENVSSRRRLKFYMDECGVDNNPVKTSDITSMRYNNQKIDEWLRRFSCSAPTSSSMMYQFPQKLPGWFTNCDEGVLSDELHNFTNSFPMDVDQCGFDPMWQRFYLFKRNLSWFHMRIKVSAWSDFMEFYKENQEKIVVLPYSCLCNGGQELRRHLICVVLTCNAKSLMYRSQFSRFRSALKTPLQFLSTIVSISSGESNAHYYVFQPVMPYIQLFAMLYMPGGIECYMESIYKNVYPYNCRSLSRQKRSNWSVEIRDIFPEKAMIFPLPRNMYFVPFNNEGAVLYVGNGQRFTVQRNDDLLTMTDLQWNTYQIEHGNCFLSNLGTRRLVLGPKIQKMLRVVAETISYKQRTIDRLRAKVKRLQRNK